VEPNCAGCNSERGSLTTHELRSRGSDSPRATAGAPPNSSALGDHWEQLALSHGHGDVGQLRRQPLEERITLLAILRVGVSTSSATSG